ncbi:TRAP transporter substrate-binding protein [Ramlibacter sp.]|uniref:TRAP transporter substrate-binding protein n=1 Tax=Ramlibacter sp. TaxID=1917967 RepID=UPI002FC73D60
MTSFVKKSFLALSVAIAAASIPAGAHAAEITWRLQTVASAGTTEYKNLVENFARHVKEETGGRVEVKTFPAGMLMGSGQVPEAVSRGTLDMGHTYLVYYSGKEPALKAVNEWPAEVHPMQGVTWFYEGGGADLMRKIVGQHNMHFLGVTALLGEQIWSKKEIKSVADLRGVKMRAAGLAADSFTRLGASVVPMPGEEVYQALQRGVIDALEFTTLPVNYGLGLHEVAKYVVVPSYSGGGTSDWIVNAASWNKLPADLKPRMEAALKKASDEYQRSAVTEEKELTQKLVQGGVKLVKWPEAEVRKMEAARLAVMKEKYAAESPLYAEKLASQLKHLQKLGYQSR